MFPLDVTEMVPLAVNDLEPLRARSPWMQLLYDEFVTWMEFIRPRHQREFTFMHDPLTAAAILDPGLVVRSLHLGVNIETTGTLTAGATLPDWQAPPTVELAVEVDAARFHRLFMGALERLAQLSSAGSAVRESTGASPAGR